MNTQEKQAFKSDLSKFVKVTTISRKDGTKEEKQSETYNLNELKNLVQTMEDKKHDCVTRYFFPDRIRGFKGGKLEGEIAKWSSWASKKTAVPAVA